MEQPKKYEPLKQLLLHFLIFWQFSYNISNAAVVSLLKFLKYFLGYLGRILNSKPLSESSQVIPVSLSCFYKTLLSKEHYFKTYVVCPSCHVVYEYDDCFSHNANGTRESKCCKHIMFPNHPRLSYRKPCSALLLKKVRNKSGITLCPIMVYPYRSLRTSVEQLVRKSNFIEECEKWRNRTISSDYLCDIYDSLVWSEFNSPEIYNFLTAPHCYMLTLNVDWFQPFDRKMYSVGAIYLTIQNLPRHLRYKAENNYNSCGNHSRTL